MRYCYLTQTIGMKLCNWKLLEESSNAFFGEMQEKQFSGYSSMFNQLAVRVKGQMSSW
jgi:hypothetical protein